MPPEEGSSSDYSGNATPIRKRKLAAVLFADIVNFSGLMGRNEIETLNVVSTRRQTIFQPIVEKHYGRIVKTLGDGFFAEFVSAYDATVCAVELQNKMDSANKNYNLNKEFLLRIGINLGEVIEEASDLFGDGVNIAARLEGVCEPGNVCISSKVYAEVKGRVNLNYRDRGPLLLKNIIEPVHVWQIDLKENVDSFISHQNTSFSRPLVLVTPFENMSGDAEQKYFSDGITEDIINELSRFKSLHVIGVKLNEINKDILKDLSYLVKGSVRKAGNRVRISAQLIESGANNHVWGENFDRSLDDVFEVQDEISKKISSIIFNSVNVDITAKTYRKPTESFAAYDYLLRGIEHHQRGTVEDNIIASDFFMRSISADPNYGEAHVWLALSERVKWSFNLDRAVLQKAVDSGRSAVTLEPMSARCHIGLGYVSLFSRDFNTAEFHHRRAIELNPNDPHIAAHMILYHAYTGKSHDCDSWYQRALQFNPQPPNWYRSFLSISKFVQRDFSRALEYSPSNPIYPADFVYRIALHGHLGQPEHANRFADQFRSIAAFNKLKLIDYALAEPFLEVSARDLLLEGLAKSGQDN